MYTAYFWNSTMPCLLKLTIWGFWWPLSIWRLLSLSSGKFSYTISLIISSHSGIPISQIFSILDWYSCFLILFSLLFFHFFLLSGFTGHFLEFIFNTSIGFLTSASTNFNFWELFGCFFSLFLLTVSSSCFVNTVSSHLCILEAK